MHKQCRGVEADCRVMSEERFIEFIHEGKVVEIRKIAG